MDVRELKCSKIHERIEAFPSNDCALGVYVWHTDDRKMVRLQEKRYEIDRDAQPALTDWRLFKEDEQVTPEYSLGPKIPYGPREGDSVKNWTSSAPFEEGCNYSVRNLNTGEQINLVFSEQ